MIFTQSTIQYAVNLRWKTFSPSDSELFESHCEKFSNIGLEIDSVDGDEKTFGVLEDGDDLLDDAECYSLAQAAASYKSNAIFLMPLTVHGSKYYWCSLISGGVPHVDFAHQDLSTALKPILNRLDDVGGPDLLQGKEISIVCSEALEEDLANSEEYHSLLLKRDNFKKTTLQPEALHTFKEGTLGTVKFRKSWLTKEGSGKKLALVLLGTAAISLIMLLAAQDEDSYEEYDFGSTGTVYTPPDYTSEINKDVSAFLHPVKKEWVLSAMKAFYDWPKYSQPFKKSKMTCTNLKAPAVQCTFEYVRDGQRPAGNAYSELKSLGSSIKSDSALRKIDASFDIQNPMLDQSIQSLTRLGSFEDALIGVDSINSEDRYSIVVGEFAAATVGGRSSYFSSLPVETSKQLAILMMAYTAEGEGVTGIGNFVSRMSEFSTFTINSITVTTGFPIKWQATGNIFIKEH